MTKHFRGSEFVWKKFKKNPVASVFGSPLVAIDVALLPARLIDEHRKKKIWERMPDEVRAINEWDAAYAREMYDSHRSQKDHSDQDMRHKHNQGRKGRKSGRESPDWRDFQEAIMAEYQSQRSHDDQKPHTGTSGSSHRSNAHRDGGNAYEHGHRPLAQSSNPISLTTANDVESRMGSAVEGPRGSTRRRQPANTLARGDERPRRMNQMRTQAQPSQRQRDLNRQPDVEPALASSKTGVSQRDFAAPQPQTHAPDQQCSKTVSKASSSLRSSRTVTQSSDDRESFVTASSRPSHGTHASRRSENTWAPAPSTVFTQPGYKPTGRADSVVPDDSLSIAGGVREMESKFGPDWRNQFPDIAEELEPAYALGARPSTGGRRGPRAHGPPPTAPQYQASTSDAQSINTTNTKDLPDTVDGESNPAFSTNLPAFKAKWREYARGRQGLHSAQVPGSTSRPSGSSGSSRASTRSRASGRPRASDRPPTIPEGPEPAGGRYQHPAEESMGPRYQAPPAHAPRTDQFGTSTLPNAAEGHYNPAAPGNVPHSFHTGPTDAISGQHIPRSRASASSSGQTPNLLNVHLPVREQHPTAEQTANEEDDSSGSGSTCSGCSQCSPPSDDEVSCSGCSECGPATETANGAAAWPGGWQQQGVQDGNGYAPPPQQSQYGQSPHY